MKALSLWQPWASAIALGWKRIETRHWSTAYRGPLAIHAAKRWTAEERDFWEMVRESSYDDDRLPDDFEIPLGALVATARLVDILPTARLLRDGISSREESWGNYGPSRFGWVFEDIVALPSPIPFKGAQGLFDVPDSVLRGEVVPELTPLPPPKLAPARAPPRQGSLLL